MFALMHVDAAQSQPTREFLIENDDNWRVTGAVKSMSRWKIDSGAGRESAAGLLTSRNGD